MNINTITHTNTVYIGFIFIANRILSTIAYLYSTPVIICYTVK